MIPKLHYISQAATSTAHLENIQKACSSGAELVQLDLEHIDGKDHLKLAQEVLKITAHFQTRLVIKTFYKIAHEVKADGIYLEQNDACPTLAREELHPWQTIGATAHSLEDLNTDTPLIGFGKITTEDVTNILATGVSGIMVAEAITADFNTIKTFNELLGASSTDEMRHTFK
jgi:thiamine-phosphate pyrophosphorylase